MNRRQLLAAAAGTAGVTSLAGCGLFRDDPEPVPPPDPLQPVLDEALALAGAYDRAVVTDPTQAGRLAPLAGDHREHATALAQLIGVALPTSAAASSAPAGAETLATLRKAEQAAHKTAVAACLQAPATRAALVGSIAAARATHAEALR
ncbi:hypothetical protein [Symbioplanes lichenis]|uniref:hypothetical protein n=1 Tax=Symbioplanes lichenis TaxID=1629072 RepID=UPI0027399AC6|nr:hypothetical protein [Actinoplanes lichenis]